MASWDPSKLTGLFRPKSATPKAEPPRRVSMRAMKAVDLKKMEPDAVLEADEFSVSPEEPTEPPHGDGAGAPRSKTSASEEQARAQQAQQAQRQGARQSAAKKQVARDVQNEATRQVAAMAEAQRARAGRVEEATAGKPDPRFEALMALERAKDPGIYFVEDRDREGHSEDQEDPALREAVEECIRLLFGVRGIHHMGPGRNDAGDPVIVIAAADGFTAESMRAVPDQVHGFATLIALPFELVPLRRSTSAR